MIVKTGYVGYEQSSELVIKEEKTFGSLGVWSIGLGGFSENAVEKTTSFCILKNFCLISEPREIKP